VVDQAAVPKAGELFHRPEDRAPTGGIGIAAEDLPDFIYLIILFFQ
jgi:hypothetical protein